jgi:hypothetical protein
MTFSAIVCALSGVSATNHFSTAGWFSLGLALLTLVFHAVVSTLLQIRTRQAINGSHIVEKGFVEGPIFNADKHLFCTVPFMTASVIIFAMWMVSVGAYLFEIVVRSTATQIDYANVAIMIVETLLFGAQAIRAYVRKHTMKATEASEAARKIRRFTTGELPRPLVLQRKFSKDSISDPSLPPATLPEKIAPVTLMFSPPAIPDSALRPEVRYNGAKTLVLVDSKIESSINTSYHGSLSASSTGSFETVASPTLH